MTDLTATRSRSSHLAPWQSLDSCRYPGPVPTPSAVNGRTRVGDAARVERASLRTEHRRHPVRKRSLRRRDRLAWRAEVGCTGCRLRAHSCHASPQAAKQTGFSCATWLPLADPFATGSEGTGSGRGGIAGAGEPVDRRTGPHNGGLAASPSRRPPSPRRPMPRHARDQYSPVRLAGWVGCSRASWLTRRFPVAHGRKRPR